MKVLSAEVYLNEVLKSNFRKSVVWKIVLQIFNKNYDEVKFI